MVIITLHDSKILLSLHYFLTPQFENFTNLLIGILGVSNPTFFLRFLRKYVTILVSISNISNNTVTMLFALDICVNKKAVPTHSVHWDLNPSPPQKHDPFFCQLSS